MQEGARAGGGVAKKLRQKSSRKGTWDAEFGALPRVVGGAVTDGNQAAYNEPTAWNPGHVPPFECRLVESAFSAALVGTKNKELICPTVPASGCSAILAEGFIMTLV